MLEIQAPPVIVYCVWKSTLMVYLRLMLMACWSTCCVDLVNFKFVERKVTDLNAQFFDSPK